MEGRNRSALEWETSREKKKEASVNELAGDSLPSEKLLSSSRLFEDSFADSAVFQRTREIRIPAICCH